MTILDAIAHIEGFYAITPSSKPNRPQRNRNPGDLDFEPWMKEFGATIEIIPDGIEESPRFACFPLIQNGFAALHELLVKNYSDLSIEAAINKYAPPVENNTVNYVDYVCRQCNCLPTTLMETLL